MKLGRYLYHERKGNFKLKVPATYDSIQPHEDNSYVSEYEELIALLPKSAWKMYNIGSGYNIDLYDKPINTHGYSYVRSFFGSTLLECLQQYLEYKHSQDVKDIPTLF